MTKSKQEMMGIREYARHRGLASDNSVRKAIAAGRIQVTSSGRIDVAKADKDWARNTDATRRRRLTKTPVKKCPVSAGPAGDFVIESGIPIPNRDRTEFYPFKKMAVGDSFLVTADRPEVKRTHILQSAKFLARNNPRFKGFRIVTAAQGPGAIRVWRVA